MIILYLYQLDYNNGVGDYTPSTPLRHPPGAYHNSATSTGATPIKYTINFIVPRKYYLINYLKIFYKQLTIPIYFTISLCLIINFVSFNYLNNRR